MKEKDQEELNPWGNKYPETLSEWMAYNNDPQAWRDKHKPFPQKIIAFIKKLPLIALGLLISTVVPYIFVLIPLGIETVVKAIFPAKTPTPQVSYFYVDHRIRAYEATSEADRYLDYEPDDEPNYQSYYEFDDEECYGGCTYHKEGCDIKGNVSYDTGERIYHVPGQKYYEETIINPDYGERWFCTEEEAEESGWRKSYE